MCRLPMDDTKYLDTGDKSDKYDKYASFLRMVPTQI